MKHMALVLKELTGLESGSRRRMGITWKVGDNRSYFVGRAGAEGRLRASGGCALAPLTPPAECARPFPAQRAPAAISAPRGRGSAGFVPAVPAGAPPRGEELVPGPDRTGRRLGVPRGRPVSRLPQGADREPGRERGPREEPPVPGSRSRIEEEPGRWRLPLRRHFREKPVSSLSSCAGSLSGCAGLSLQGRAAASESCTELFKIYFSTDAVMPKTTRQRCCRRGLGLRRRWPQSSPLLPFNSRIACKSRNKHDAGKEVERQERNP
ncbi:uncharacterized protein LOC103657412 [Ursus maritimus]|uniref:Uncharacterized protein LOC103657412 n=1 Tax=Ursus maritimus TaxID=29073 RepID=A0A8M1H482_URSMA|nr:uncharacterized protein LOC103657412 [Ursus maritimus]